MVVVALFVGARLSIIFCGRHRRNFGQKAACACSIAHCGARGCPMFIATFSERVADNALCRRYRTIVLQVLLILHY